MTGFDWFTSYTPPIDARLAACAVASSHMFGYCYVVAKEALCKRVPNGLGATRCLQNTLIMAGMIKALVLPDSRNKPRW